MDNQKAQLSQMQQQREILQNWETQLTERENQLKIRESQLIQREKAFESKLVSQNKPKIEIGDKVSNTCHGFEKLYVQRKSMMNIEFLQFLGFKEIFKVSFLCRKLNQSIDCNKHNNKDHFKLLISQQKYTKGLNLPIYHIKDFSQIPHMFEHSISKIMGQNFFGYTDWLSTQLANDVGEYIPLPPNILSIIQSQCPVFPQNKIMDTHFLYYLPSQVNGENFNFSKWGLEDGKQGIMTKFSPKYVGSWASFYAPPRSYEFGFTNNFVAKSEWVLILKRGVPDSSGKLFSEEEKILNKYSQYLRPTPLQLMSAICLYHMNQVLKYKKQFKNDDDDLLMGIHTVAKTNEKPNGRRVAIGNYYHRGFEGNKLDSIGVNISQAITANDEKTYIQDNTILVPIYKLNI